jgi:hypothetical protein
MTILSLRFSRILAATSALLALTSLTAAPLPLRVAGNQLLDSNGRPVRLRGVNCAGMEFSNDGQGKILMTVLTAVAAWHANLVRLPLSQDRWFGKAPGQTDGGKAYRELVREVVVCCSGHNAYILLDLHWSDAGVWGKNIGQHNLPDENSVAFWTDLAPRYRGDPSVLFDLYNEPTNKITWDQWSGGGPMTETDEKTGVVLSYRSVGLPALLEAIRATGTRNVVVAGGTNWSYEVGGILQGHAIPDPTGDGVVYANHPYPHAYARIGRETIAQWAARMEDFSKRYPMIVTEFGSIERMWPFPKEWNYDDEKWNREMIRVIEAHGWNWTAWDFHPTAWPCLVSDWDYTPTPHFGVWVKQALARNLETGE